MWNLTYMFIIKKRLSFFSVWICVYLFNISENFWLLLKIKNVHSSKRFRKLLKRYNSINGKPGKYSNIIYPLEEIRNGIFDFCCYGDILHNSHIQSGTMEIHLHCCLICWLQVLIRIYLFNMTRVLILWYLTVFVFSVDQIKTWWHRQILATTRWSAGLILVL